MKRLVTLFLTLAMAASLTACGSGSTGGSSASSAGGAAQAAGSAKASGSGSSQYNISIGYSTAEDTAQGQAALTMKKYMEKKSNGSISVSVYPNSQIGTDQEMLESVQGGSLTMLVSSTANQVGFVKDAEIFDIPYAFRAVDGIEKTIQDKNFLKALNEQYGKQGLKIPLITQAGFRILTCNKAVKTPGDLKGVSIRTQASPVQMATWKMLGANPTPIAFNEVYTALQQHTVDAQENPLEYIVSQKFYEQQKYIIRDNHVSAAAVWVMNKAFYESLPNDIKTIFDEAMEEGRKTADAYEKTATEKQEKVVTDYGCQIIDLTDGEWQQFHDKTTDIWKTVAKDVDPSVMKAFEATLKEGIVPAGLT